MKKLSGMRIIIINLFLLSYPTFVMASRELALESLSNKFYGVLPGLGLAVIFYLTHQILGFFCKSVFGFDFRTDTGAIICIIMGFLANRVIPVMF